MNSTTKCNSHKLKDSHAATNQLNQQHPSISLFVYGTLKRGFVNHNRFCRNAIDIRPASTWGRLYQLPAGYPALIIPESAILAHGTADPLADATTQARIIDTFLSTSPHHRPSGDWDLIHGELVTLPDPLRDMPPIDQLEGFFPSCVSLYQRILLSVFVHHKSVPCWAYIMQGCSKHCRVQDGRWGQGPRSF